MKQLILILLTALTLVGCAKSGTTGYHIAFSESEYGVYLTQDATKRVIIKEGFFRYYEWQLDQYGLGWWTAIHEGTDHSDLSALFGKYTFDNGDFLVHENVNGVWLITPYLKQPE